MKIMSAETAHEISTHFKTHSLEKPMQQIFTSILNASITEKTSCSAKIIIYDFYRCPYHVSFADAKIAVECLAQLGYKISNQHTEGHEGKEGSIYYCFTISW